MHQHGAINFAQHRFMTVTHFRDHDVNPLRVNPEAPRKSVAEQPFDHPAHAFDHATDAHAERFGKARGDAQ